MLSRAIAKSSRAPAAPPTTVSANIENTTSPTNVRARGDPIQYWNTPGNPPFANTASLGIASVKPISTIIPRNPEMTTAPTMARGTERRASTASSDMSAAVSKPTIV